MEKISYFDYRTRQEHIVNRHLRIVALVPGEDIHELALAQAYPADLLEIRRDDVIVWNPKKNQKPSVDEQNRYLNPCPVRQPAPFPNPSSEIPPCLPTTPDPNSKILEHT